MDRPRVSISISTSRYQRRYQASFNCHWYLRRSPAISRSISGRKERGLLCKRGSRFAQVQWQGVQNISFNTSRPLWKEESCVMSRVLITQQFIYNSRVSVIVGICPEAAGAHLSQNTALLWWGTYPLNTHLTHSTSAKKVHVWLGNEISKNQSIVSNKHSSSWPLTGPTKGQWSETEALRSAWGTREPSSGSSAGSALGRGERWGDGRE